MGQTNSCENSNETLTKKRISLEDNLQRHNEPQIKLKSNIVMRDSRFELLRIVCMVMIVAHHFSIFGSYFAFYNDLNMYLVNMLRFGGKIGVNVFLIISGYFMAKSKAKFSKFVKLELQVIFYCCFAYLVYVLVNAICYEEIVISMRGVLSNFFPILLDTYWFVQVYMIIYAFSNLINRLAKKMPCWLFAILIFALFVLSANNYFAPDLTFSCGLILFRITGGLGLFTVLPMYLIGIFIRLHPCKIMDIKPLHIVLFLGLMVYIILDNTFSSGLSAAINHPECILCSIEMFLVFRNLKIKSNKVINTISSATYGVYLLHNNGAYLRTYIWINIFKLNILASSTAWFPVLSIIIIIALYCFCTLFDLARQYYIEKPLFRLFSRIKERYQSKRLNKSKNR